MKTINTNSMTFELAMAGLTIGVAVCTWKAVGKALAPIRDQSNLVQDMGFGLITYTAVLVVSDHIIREVKEVVNGYNVLVGIRN